MKVAHFTRNFSWKTHLDQSFYIPWLQNKCAINCAIDRTFSSSIPVRYIPKTSSKIKELRQSSHGNGFDEKEGVNCLDSNPSRIEISFGVRCVKSNVSLNKNIHSQLPINSCKIGDAKPEPDKIFDEAGIYEGGYCQAPDMPQMRKTRQDGEKLAIELLAKRAFTAFELGKKLQGKRFPRDIIEAVISEFQGRGLINDYLYAETFSRSRWSSSSWGPRRIKQALMKKGVSEDDTEKAVKLVFEESESNEYDEESIAGMSKPSMDQLFVQVSKQWRKGQNVPREKKKARINRWLQYRGFSWAVISIILKKLESQ